MVPVVDTEDMFAIAFLIGLVVLCVLAAFKGVDSRHDDVVRNHRNI
jgi:hypothetical protein